MAGEKKKHTILICDDEEGIRESFKLILGDDYDLEFAVNGIEALERLKNLSPAALILDIKMPKLHGIDALRQIKRLKPDLPVVIVTGYQSVEMAQECLSNGAADYIPKPFDTEQIKKSVRNILPK